jgi:nucleotide-binding universal stress UspA family protein
MKVLLVATDGSEGGTAAVREAADLAAAYDAELVVLTVIPRDIAPRSMAEGIREYARAEHLTGGELEGRSVVADNILDEARAIVEDRDDLKASYTSRAGDPAEEILACARERAADMIYLGSRGSGPLAAFFYGSVSRRVADLARCTVKIVPTSK